MLLLCAADTMTLKYHSSHYQLRPQPNRRTSWKLVGNPGWQPGFSTSFQLHRVIKKTCDYIFYNNFNNNCPITIIFGIVSGKSMCHRKMVSFPTSPI